MRLSIFSILDEEAPRSEEPGSPQVDRYQQTLGMVQEADRLGFDTFWVAEHHFHHGGTLPSPPVWLAAAAQVSRRIRLGPLVAVLPFHNPISLAEDYALVDRLSGGRLEMGVGSGNTPPEFPGFGLDFTDSKPLFQERLPLLLEAWRGNPVPSPSGAPVRINVRPVQRPHPPVWIAASQVGAIRWIAQNGFRWALIPYAIVSNYRELRTLVQEYHDHTPSSGSGRVLAAFHVYMADPPSAGIEALERYLGARLRTQSERFSEKARRDPEGSTVSGLIRRGLVLVGSEEEVGRRLHELEDCGITDMAAIVDFGGLPTALVRESMRALARLIRGTP
jgi:alkanesulfonate monooxygenase SsuD/methylene tetrahydromethanopterin reductase-like flavin-dependent oxidoreductase (luciferase family)